jgi:hypothetical protein
MQKNGVTTTVADILDAAYGTSIENQPGDLAAESTELLQLVNRALRRIFAAAARVNPNFFAMRLVVDYDTDLLGWRRPVIAESVWRAEKSDGTQVTFVPIEDRRAEPGKPAVYPFAQAYFPAGNPKDPGSSDTLTFYFSKRPDPLSDLEATLDPQWPEQFNPLLINTVGLYLSEKEGANRKDEVPAFLRELERDSAQFVQFLEHETVGIRRRMGHMRRFNTQSMVPVMSILTGRAGGGMVPGVAEGG